MTGTACPVYRHRTPSDTDTKSCWLYVFTIS